jgi:hypothetical protein
MIPRSAEPSLKTPQKIQGNLLGSQLNYSISNSAMIYNASPVKLRDHPLMSYRGMRSWPPTWGAHNANPCKVNWARQPKSSRIIRPNRCYLFIEHDGGGYIGALLCDDNMFCSLIGQILRDHISAQSACIRKDVC